MLLTPHFRVGLIVIGFLAISGTGRAATAPFSLTSQSQTESLRHISAASTTDSAYVVAGSSLMSLGLLFGRQRKR
jgi:LPXTG-motif cell wall-anchored protein